MRYLMPVIASFLYLTASLSAHAADLLDIFIQAEQSDPVYLEAQANYRAQLEIKPQARALLLPDVRFRVNTFDNFQDITSPGAPIGIEGEQRFNTHGYSLDLVQPLFRLDAFLQYRQTDSVIARAHAELQAAWQELAMRVIERYFDVLAAQDNLDFARAEERSLERQLEEARQRFEVGLTAITDLQEAQAGYDRAVAEVIEAENEIDNTREALREITGEYVDRLAALEEDVPLISPTPDDIEIWTTTALEENLNVIAARFDLDTAQREIDVQKSGHFPRIDLVARTGYESSGGGRFGGVRTTSDAIGVEFNMPLFLGGAVTSRTREAHEFYSASIQRLNSAQRSAQRLTRQSYLGVMSGISRVKAFKQAIVSSETALEATNAGFEVGTRTAVDVVTAERALSDARRNYARSRYDYIINSMRLKQAAGTLNNEDIAQINLWLNGRQ